MDDHGSCKRLQVCLPPAVAAEVTAHRARLQQAMPGVIRVSESAAVADLVTLGLSQVRSRQGAA